MITPKKYFKIHNGLYDDTVTDAMWRRLSYTLRANITERVFDKLWEQLPSRLSASLVVGCVWQLKKWDFYDE